MMAIEPSVPGLDKLRGEEPTHHFTTPRAVRNVSLRQRTRPAASRFVGTADCSRRIRGRTTRCRDDGSGASEAWTVSLCETARRPGSTRRACTSPSPSLTCNETTCLPRRAEHIHIGGTGVCRARHPRRRGLVLPIHPPRTTIDGRPRRPLLHVNWK
jgi:hypothetical protein